jgi:hypothetical protein
MFVCVTRTTLILEDACIEGVRRLAQREHRNMSRVVNELLADGLQRRIKSGRTPFKIPVCPMGTPRINLGDRDALEAVMEE